MEGRRLPEGPPARTRRRGRVAAEMMGRRAIAPRPNRRPGRALARGACLALLLLLPALPQGARAQGSGAQTEVVRAVLAHLRGSLPSGAATLDPEGYCTAQLIGWQCPAPFREAADALGYRLSGRSFTLVCLGGPRSCRLIGTESLVVVTPPSVSGNRATAEVRVWARAAARSAGLVERHLRLSLARGRGGWEVVGEEPAGG